MKRPRTLKNSLHTSPERGRVGLTHQAESPASATTVPVANRPNATSNTNADAVAPPITTLKTIIDSIPITTRLKPEAWRDLLEQAGILDKYSHIPIGLLEGFLIGVELHDIDRTFIPPNHFRTEAEAEIIRAKFADEIALGRILQAFDPIELEQAIGHYRTAPMAVVMQKRARIVLDHSHPRNELALKALLASSQPTTPTRDRLSDTMPITRQTLTGETSSTITIVDPSNISINSLIDPDNYRCDWGTFSDCYLLVADAPEGMELLSLSNNN